MRCFLAYAESADTSNSSMVIVLSGLCVLAVAAIAAIVPICICWKRHHRQTEPITALLILWGLVATISAIYFINSQMKWSREQMLRIESGYFDPTDQTDAPAIPWVTWGGLATVYAALVCWSFAQKNPPAPQIPFAQRTK
jgi:hypothetical protein